MKMIVNLFVNEEEFRKNLGKNIQRIRLYRGIGGKELGEKVGLTKQTISKIENGKEENLGLKFLLRICEKLNATPEELFQKDGNLLSLRFVISEHNIETLKELIKMVKELIESK